MDNVKETLEEVVERVPEKKPKMKYTKDLYRDAEDFVEVAMATTFLPVALTFDAIDSILSIFD